jgi:3-hydroxyisobutyrate dehydrogenase-like beta-hydroxyacid dehydrogenase
MKIGFIGLGVMGFPMAGHLQSKGYDVRVYNRTAATALRWQDQFQGSVADTPQEVALGSDVVCLCVGNDDDVRAMTLGDTGVLKVMRPGSVLVDHTTASADLARELFAVARLGEVGFVDAPVSGGQVGAEKGALTIMCGGDAETFAQVEHVLLSYAKCVRLLGPAGSGQLAKMVNQICIAGVVQGLSEALNFSERVGLDTEAVIEVIRQGAAQSWQMENRSTSMLAGHYEHGFAVDWMRKDLGLVKSVAAANAIEIPLTEQVDHYYADVQSMGGGRWDTSSLLKRLQLRHDLIDKTTE